MGYSNWNGAFFDGDTSPCDFKAWSKVLMCMMQIMLTTKTCCVLLTGAHLCEEGLGPAQFLMLVSVSCEGSC